MLVKDVMTRGVEVVRPSDTLQEAAGRMKDRDVGPLPVCDGDRLVGVITDRDITVRATAEGYDPWTEKVGEIMTPEVVTCFEDQEVAEAERLMKARHVHRLMVLGRDHRLVGILSSHDLKGR
jgi:CBS domain-containing protein